MPRLHSVAQGQEPGVDPWSEKAMHYNYLFSHMKRRQNIVMKTLSCHCGFTTKSENNFQVESAIWHHAIHDHADMLKSMTVDMLEQWLLSNDEQLKAGA